MDTLDNNTTETLRKILTGTIEIMNSYMLQLSSLIENLNEGNGDSYAESEDSSMPSKYQQKVAIGVNENGATKYINVHAKTKNELIKKIAEAINNREQSPEWSSYCDTWFNTYHRNKVTPKKCTCDLSVMNNHVKKFFEGIEIKNITTQMIQEALNSVSHLAKSTVRDIWNLMRQVFDSAVEDKLISTNPASSKRLYNPSKEKERERKILSPYEWNDIRLHLDNIKSSSDRAFVAIMLYTGCRPSEVLGLEWKHIDFDKKILYIEQSLTFDKGSPVLGDTKTVKSRRVEPIHDELVPYIADIERKSDTSFVFHPVKSKSSMMTETAFRRMWERISKSIDLHGVTAYGFRHTYNTNANNANVNQEVTRMLMGHTTTRMTSHYYHGDIDTMHEANNKIFQSLTGT